MSNTPTIKQLEWRHLPSKQREKWIAKPIENFLEYVIVKYKWNKYFDLYIKSALIDSRFTLADAQYAAQADFEKKIRSCLL